MKKLLCALLAALLCMGSALAATLPKASDDFYYYDDANVLDYETRAVIYFNNVALAKACGAEVVVAAVKNTGNDSCERYAEKLFNSWGIGDKKKDNGFLLLLSVNGDDYYMAKGNGTNAILTPGEVGDLLYDYLEADFAAGNYAAGAEKVFKQVFDTLTGYYGLNLAYQDAQSLIRSGKIEAETVESTGFGAIEREPAAQTSSEGGSMYLGLFIVIAIIVLVIIARSRRTRRRRGAVITPPPAAPTVVVAPRIGLTGGVRRRAPRPQPPAVAPRPPMPGGGLFGSGLFGGSSGSSRSSYSSGRSSSGSSSSRSYTPSRSSSSSSRSSSRSGGFGGARGGGGRTSGSGAGRRR